MRRIAIAFVLIAASVTAAEKTLKPAAREQLAHADALVAKLDYSGALDAYMNAVKIDPAAANLDRMYAYAPPLVITHEPTTAEKAAAKNAEEADRKVAPALRQYLQIHPGDRRAVDQLILRVDRKEGEAILQPFFVARPDDPELYALRAMLRARNGSWTALDDYENAAELDPKNPERRYIVGVMYYERTAKDASLTDAQKRDAIRRGITALQRAEAMKPDYFEAFAYHSLLLREQAKIEKDPAEKKKLTADADALKAQAIEIIKKKKAAAQNKGD